MVPLERLIVVSYRLSIVTVVLSESLGHNLPLKYLQRSNQQWMGHFGAKFWKEGVKRSKPNSNAIW